MKTLTIYDKHPHMDAYRVGGSFTPYAVVAKDKRFTDAELAAEYWRANAVGWMHEDACEFTAAARDAAQTATIQRFITFPHFDEVAA